MHRPDSCNLFRGLRIYTVTDPERRNAMKTLMIIAALCLSLGLMSGITPASQSPVFRLNALTPAADGRAATAAGSPRKGAGGGQARWLRVVPGLFR